MKNIAIIPARSGSKGVINKNIKEFAGKPLMSYSIDAALQSGQFDEVMVSTDSEEYATIARKLGASVPFLRSAASATDTSSSWDMVEETLLKYEENGKLFDTFCLLQPTSPLRTSEDIRQAYLLYKEKSTFAVVSVCEVEHSPLWVGKLPANLEFINFINPKNMISRQAGGKFYRPNGAIYIVNIDRFRRDRFIYQKGSYAYIMSQDRSVDIDTEIDFITAEAIMKYYRKKL